MKPERKITYDEMRDRLYEQEQREQAQEGWYEKAKREGRIVGEDMICPVTKEHCDDECCTVGSECNISGNDNGISDVEQAQEQHALVDKVAQANGEWPQELDIDKEIEKESKDWTMDIKMGKIDYQQRQWEVDSSKPVEEIPYSQGTVLSEEPVVPMYNDLQEIVDDLYTSNEDTVIEIIHKLENNINNQCYICRNPIE